MPKRILQGVAVRDARDKTVIVRVERRVMHPVYKKFIMRSKRIELPSGRRISFAVRTMTA